LTTLGADLAAMYGGTAAEAIESITALMRGVADSIEKYGVSIKQADVDTRLHAQGRDDLTGKARKQAEMDARLALLYEQSADAQGQSAREANTTAGQMQRLTATWDDMREAIGSRLLPIFNRFLRFLTGTVAPFLQSHKDDFLAV